MTKQAKRGRKASGKERGYEMKSLFLCFAACLPMVAIITISFETSDWQYWASIPAAWWISIFVILADEAA